MKNGQQKFMTVGTLKRRRFLIVLTISLIAVLAAVYFAVFCRVKLVTVENNEKISDPIILSEVNIMPYRHLFSISERKIEKQILAISPYVKSVEMKRKLPSEIVLVLEEYSADYYIIENGRCYLLSDTLFVLEEILLTEIELQDAAYLALPEIKEDEYYTLEVGTTLRFTDKENDTYIKALMETISASPLAKGITSLTLDEKANITADIDEKYHLKLGNAKELEKKLDLCEAAIEYLTENMAGVKGTLHAWTTEKITFEITGVAENP